MSTFSPKVCDVLSYSVVLINVYRLSECLCSTPRGIISRRRGDRGKFLCEQNEISIAYSTTYKCKTLIFPIASCTNRLLIIDPMSCFNAHFSLRLRPAALPDQTGRGKFLYFVDQQIMRNSLIGPDDLISQLHFELD